jgi:chitinase
VSFTVPTSYWYLRWFDLAAVDHVDWVNVMSYDLHGVWDQDNPIGNHVLAHTNLTEIKLALDLFWRSELIAPSTPVSLTLHCDFLAAFSQYVLSNLHLNSEFCRDQYFDHC